MIFRPVPAFPGSVLRRVRGQGLTEYVVIVFLVAVGTLGVVGLFGDNLRQLFGASAESLAGNESAENKGTSPPAGVLQWSLKGGKGASGNPGGVANRPAPGGGGTVGGNPGGTVNSEPSRGNLRVD